MISSKKAYTNSLKTQEYEIKMLSFAEICVSFNMCIENELLVPLIISIFFFLLHSDLTLIQCIYTLKNKMNYHNS